MTSVLRTICLCLAALVALPAATASAARSTTYPVVTSIAPMQAKVGDRMKITGRGFVPGRFRNTVVLQRQGQPAVFVKAASATSTRLTITLPDKLTRFVPATPAKFRVRVLARRFGRAFTTLAKSPTIGLRAGAAPVAVPGAPVAGATPLAPGATPAATPTAPATPPPPPDCDADGLVDDQDPHDDADGLPDALENQLKTDRCLADTDGDGLQDGWEYRSAVDLNRESCPAFEYPTPCEPARPWPGKRPYPNPLDPADAGTDFDGDALPARLEHAAWMRKGDRNIDKLWYSDGLQASQDANPTDGCRGMVVPPALDGQFALTPESEIFYSLDHDQDRCLNDAERDEDGDWLSNREESSGVLSGPTWTEKRWEEAAFPVRYAGTEWLDPDTDGDGVKDGQDDQDFDDFWNVEERFRGRKSSTKPPPGLPRPPGAPPWIDTGARDGLWVSPFNPCLPTTKSRTCPVSIEFGTDIYPPFVEAEATYMDWPIMRWPLYGRAQFQAGTPEEELWNGLPVALQVMPPVHPVQRTLPVSPITGKHARE
jgi:hypothetical protein